jgi:hypothetical protein
MPLTVFDIKGVPGHRRERIEAAVVAGANTPRLRTKLGSPPTPSKVGFAFSSRGHTALSVP